MTPAIPDKLPITHANQETPIGSFEAQNGLAGVSNSLAENLLSAVASVNNPTLPACAEVFSGDRQQDWAKKMLLPDGLNLEQQNQWIDSMQTRAGRLGYEENNPLFVVIERDVLFKTKLVKPLDDAKLVLADLYRQKYGVHIVLETGRFKSEDGIKHWVNHHLAQAQGREIAFLTRTEEPGKELHERNYLWHMTPFILREEQGLLRVLNLDSAWRVDPGMYGALRLMAQEGQKIEFLTLKQKRQADYGSCHTDAMVVAKDVLRALQVRRLQNPEESLLALFEAVPNPEQEHLVHENVQAFISELPSFLHKTTQYSNAMRFQKFQPDAQVMSQKQLSISQHRSNYTRDTPLVREQREPLSTPTLQSKALNHYLTFKGFYFAEKVLAHLESIGSITEVSNYVSCLQQAALGVKK